MKNIIWILTELHEIYPSAMRPNITVRDEEIVVSVFVKGKWYMFPLSEYDNAHPEQTVSTITSIIKGIKK